MNYFTNFPVINYFDSQTRNIILKAAFIAKIFNDTDTFYPYVIKDNERPDNIAFNEYNDATLDWVIYFSNNIIDPYYSLPLDYENFLGYLRKNAEKVLEKIIANSPSATVEDLIKQALKVL